MAPFSRCFTAGMSFSLLRTLPPELLLEIVKELDFEDLENFQRASSYLADFIKRHSNIICSNACKLDFATEHTVLQEVFSENDQSTVPVKFGPHNIQELGQAKSEPKRDVCKRRYANVSKHGLKYLSLLAYTSRRINDSPTFKKYRTHRRNADTFITKFVEPKFARDVLNRWCSSSSRA